MHFVISSLGLNVLHDPVFPLEPNVGVDRHVRGLLADLCPAIPTTSSARWYEISDEDNSSLKATSFTLLQVQGQGRLRPTFMRSDDKFERASQ